MTRGALSALIAVVIVGCTSPAEQLRTTVEREPVPETFDAVPGDLKQLERFVYAEGFGAAGGVVPDSPGAIQQAATANARSNLAERLGGLPVGEGLTLRSVVEKGADPDSFNALIDEAEVLSGGPLRAGSPVRRALVRLSLARLGPLLRNQPQAAGALASGYDPAALQAAPPRSADHGGWASLTASWDTPAARRVADRADGQGPTWYLATPAPAGEAPPGVTEVVVAGAVYDRSGIRQLRAGRRAGKLSSQPPNPKLPRVSPFRLVLPLQPGENTLIVAAEDGVGNVSAIRIVIRRPSP